MQFQWYPGHMTKAKRAMQEDLKLIDVIVELVDARVPLSSKNPDIDQMANGKSRVILLNKYDLADDKKTQMWMEYYEGKPIVYSLGNFIFGSSIPRTALLQVTWDIKDGAEMGEDEPVLRLIPGTSGAGYTRMLTEEDKRREFFRYMESISYGVWFEEDGEVKKDEDGYREESE